MFLSSSDTKRTLGHLSLFTSSARENWFQYVRRVYATAINFPCITTLGPTLLQVVGALGLFILLADSSVHNLHTFESGATKYTIYIHLSWGLPVYFHNKHKLV